MNEQQRTKALTDLSVWVLRIALALQCLGLGFSYLWHPLERESDIYGTLFFEWGLPEPFAQSFEDIGMWIVAVGGLLILLVNLWFSCENRLWRPAEAAILTTIIVWEIFFAVGITFRGGEFMSYLALGSNGLRMAVPLCLLLHTLRLATAWIDPILRLGTALTFLVHGWKAWCLSPSYTTLLIGASLNLFAYDAPESTVIPILKTIGLVDIVIALMLLTVKIRYIVLYMAAWGLFTAMGRTVGSSLSSFPETLLRMVHAGGPLVLYIEWSRWMTQNTVEVNIGD